MNTKILMTAAAVFLGIIGIGLTFLPQEIGEFLSTATNPISILILQILGAAYLGFAMINWMTRNNLIGGIYSKPLMIGNLVHFLVSSLAIIKIIGGIENHYEIILSLAIVYSGFTIWFVLAFMKTPKRLKSVD